MDLSYSIKVIFLLLQTTIGTLANAFIPMAYAYTTCTEKNLKPIDTILCHLAIANLVRLLPRGPPEIMKEFGLRNILDDDGCKFVLYITRAARGVSICMTSLLSVYQAITLTPATARWCFLKSRLQKDIMLHIVSFWLFNMLLYITFAMQLFAPRNGTIPAFAYNLGICYTNRVEQKLYYLTMCMIFGHDIFFVGLMLISSVYILYVLKRHRKQVQYIRSSSQNPKDTVETKAAKSVIKLVTLYVFFYGVDTCIMVYTSIMTSFPSLITEHY
ncbi:olfactory receptor class A-like protein 1 [Rhinatrema bivittatum]|uniref:olfactory receptor class A-like protein 1 n=1 Tax=Rhinatrema bivittatum TaxID=194408 RepID=UPI00112EE26E|nr:olfactory receptor class A-like protein 1 [Rhinatrema bivittatum]